MTNRELAELLGGTLHGETRDATSLTSPGRLGLGAVAVALTASTLPLFQAPEAAQLAAVVTGDVEVMLPCPQIRVADTRLALARLTAAFDRRPAPASGRHPSAAVAADAELAAGVALGAGVVIGPGTRIGPNSALGPGCVVGAGSTIGSDCRLHANVTLYDGVWLGDRVTLHSGCVIGADGFGYATGASGAVKIHHLGGVVLEDEVEIGANSAVDRGTLEPTRIGARSKLDNFCQIAHNVEIGSDCLLAGMVAVAGTTRIGNRVVLGGAVVVADHLVIGDDVRAAGGSGISKNIPAGEVWGGVPARPYRQWIRSLYLQNRLERIWQFVRERS